MPESAPEAADPAPARAATARLAPGAPGASPLWTSSDKSGVGTALSTSTGSTSLVWFTLGHGIVNEVYYPRLDRPCTRDMGFLVADGRSFFSDERDDAEHRLEYLAEGVPAYRLTNTCKGGRYRIEK